MDSIVRKISEAGRPEEAPRPVTLPSIQIRLTPVGNVEVLGNLDDTVAVSYMLREANRLYDKFLTEREAKAPSKIVPVRSF